jgi:hypothetical protein
VAPPTGLILSLMSPFSVAKGDDIRTVFDASKSKLNEALFAPWLSLATADAMARTVDVDYFGAKTTTMRCSTTFGVDMTHQYLEEALLQGKQRAQERLHSAGHRVAIVTLPVRFFRPRLRSWETTPSWETYSWRP